MNDGFTGIALIRLMASSSVPFAFGLAGLSKPTWLSLICRNVMAAGSAACAEPTSPSERGTPPEMVQSTPVPAQVMHSSTRRRLTPGWFSSRSLIANLHGPLIGLRDLIGRGQSLFPEIPGEGDYRESVMIISAPFSAIIAVGVLVLPEVMVGITEASTTRSPSR